MFTDEELQYIRRIINNNKFHNYDRIGNSIIAKIEDKSVKEE